MFKNLNFFLLLQQLTALYFSFMKELDPINQIKINDEASEKIKFT